MNKHLVIVILSVLLLISLLALTTASEIKLVCLQESQTIKFSACNPAIPDRTCQSSQGCQYCATYNQETQVYCPANINLCNAIEGLSCLNLVETQTPPSDEGNENNGGSQNTQTNPPEQQTNPGQIKKDVAYIVKTPAGADNILLTELHNNSYSFDIIYESQIQETNFNLYPIIIVGNQRLDNPKAIPVHEHKSLIINQYNYYRQGSNPQLGWSRQFSSTSSPNLIKTNNAHPITSNLPNTFRAYTTRNDPNLKTFILKGEKPRGMNILVSSGLQSNAVIATIEPGVTYLNGNQAKERAVFFGITKPGYWTQETKQLFKNSLDWLVQGSDIDGDGYFSDEDCNDRDSNINPASRDPFLNCKNDAPIVQQIPNLKFYKGERVAIKIEARDPENDALIYKINDEKFTFSQQDTTFYWQTTVNDEGSYRFTIDVSDKEFTISQSINIEINNRRPELLTAIPNVNWNEDTSFTLDLNNYFSDADGDSLRFGIEDTSDNKNINLNSLSNGIFEFSSKKDWNGEDWIIFSASDREAKTLSNRIKLIVNPVNDAPMLKSQILDLIWKEDAQSQPLDLSIYFGDIDSQLQYEISGNIDIKAEIKNNKLIFSQPKDWFGTEKIVIKANDGEFIINSNEITLTVIEQGEPPVFSEMDCETEIEEDRVYTCTLKAIDFENNELKFSVLEKSNLECSTAGDTLTYSSKKNYNGQAGCMLSVSDIHGEDNRLLEVKINPINDPPTIITVSPQEQLIKIPERTNKQLTITANDVDSAINISWFLDGIKVKDGTSYIFNKSSGTYLLKVVASDSKFDTEYTWNIVSLPSQEFACSELSGFICSENKICPSTPFATKDTNLCCPAQCVKTPPKFSDAKPCNEKDNSLVVEIDSPKESDKIELGEKISAELKIENNFEKDQDLDIEVHLYNVEKERAEKSASTTSQINKDRSKIIKLDLDIPFDLDLKNNYIIFAKADDEICNQDYQEIKLERPKEKLSISEFSIPKSASCGELIKTALRVENLGSSDENVKLTLKNRELNVNKEESFELEEFGKKDMIKKEYEIKIPDNASGDYIIRATLEDKEIISELRNIKIECGQKPILTTSESTTEQEIIKLGKESPIKQKEDESYKSEEYKKPYSNTILIATVILTTIIAILFLFFIYSITRRNPSR